MNNTEKNVENNISILNDNSATSNGKVTKPTVSDSVYGISKAKPVINEEDNISKDFIKDVNFNAK